MNHDHIDGPAYNKRAEPQNPNQQSSPEEEDLPADLFDELAIPERPSFSDWLKEQKGQEDVVGDLSRSLSQIRIFRSIPGRPAASARKRMKR